MTNETESATIKAEAKTSNEEMTATVMTTAASEAENAGSSMEDAIELPLNETQYGCFCCPECETWYKFVPPTSGTYTVHGSGDTATSGGLYDNTGNLLIYKWFGIDKKVQEKVFYYLIDWRLYMLIENSSIPAGEFYQSLIDDEEFHWEEIKNKYLDTYNFMKSLKNRLMNIASYL